MPAYYTYLGNSTACCSSQSKQGNFNIYMRFFLDIASSSHRIASSSYRNESAIPSTPRCNMQACRFNLVSPRIQFFSIYINCSSIGIVKLNFRYVAGDQKTVSAIANLTLSGIVTDSIVWLNAYRTIHKFSC